MEAAVAVEAILERALAFVRDPAIKLLHIVASAELRKAALDVVMSLEFRATNRSAFASFEQAHTVARPGWAERTEHARRQHDARREAMAEHGETLPPLPEAPTGAPAVAFASQLWQLLEARPANTTGIVAVLGPEQVENQRAWSDALTRLIEAQELSEVRFVVIDVERSTIARLVDALGPRAMALHCTLDPTRGEALLQALAEGKTSAGAAPKGVIPPERRGTPPPGPQQGVSRSIAAAALAAGRGDFVAAIGSAKAAAEACDDELRPTLELMLGAYLLQAGQLAAAEETYETARASAEREERAVDVANARFALASASLLRRDGHAALVHYAEAAIAAERSGDATLAIEGCRVTGQLATDLGMQPQAVTFLSKAVNLAEGDKELGPLTSAGDAARRLARLCRKRGAHDAADELEAKAARFDRASPPPTPARPAPTEPTEELPVEELAAIHWAGVPPPASPDADPRLEDAVAPAGSIVRRRFTADELQRLHRAVGDAMVEETTALLSESELHAMRDGPPPLLMSAAAPTAPPSETTADPFAHLDEAALALMRARVAQADDDDDSMLDLDAAARLREELFGPNPKGEDS